jgi:glycosyltransferase involved in cell wall biosynthesis
MHTETSIAELSQHAVYQPLLSICIPTYNRAHLLRVSLQTLLPQVKECATQVEVWISDNASSDNTAEVVEASRAIGPLHYSRNDSNLGYHGNTIKLSTQLARGEYVWVLGDDDLLMPGMIRRILDTIHAHRDLETFYLNYGIARYPDDWPAICIGGYTGKLRRLHVDSVEDRSVRYWKEFIRVETDICTEMFAQIVRRDIWVNYWHGRSVDAPAANTMTAVYPHSVMWAETIMNMPSYFIGEPATACFHGSQWYSAHLTHYMLFPYTQLFQFYHKMGLDGVQLQECERGLFTLCEHYLNLELLDRTKPALGMLARFLSINWLYATAWRSVARAIRRADRPWLISKVLGGLGRVNRLLRLFDLWTRDPEPGQMAHPRVVGHTNLQELNA